MASRTLRSNSKGSGRPLRSYSVTTRNVKNQAATGRGRPPLKSKEKQIEKTKLKHNDKDQEKTLTDVKQQPTEELQQHIDDLTVSNPSPIKRKRGRPRNSSLENQNDAKKIKTTNEEPVMEKQAEKLDTSETKTIEPAPSRRQPRMASLNAIAKVNAVLESYRSDKPRGDTGEKSKPRGDIGDKSKPRGDIAVEENIERKRENEDKSSRSLKSEKPNNKNLLMMQNSNKPKKSENQKKFYMKFSDSRFTKANRKEKVGGDVKRSIEISNNCGKEVPKIGILTPIIEMHDQSIQTDVWRNTKAVQTESFIFPKDKSLSLCTCKKISSAHGYYNKYSNVDCSLGHSLHMKSTVLAHCHSHTLGVPIVKRHTYRDSSVTQYSYQGATENITALLDHCIKRNFSHKSSYPACARLLYVAAQNKAIVAQKQKLAALDHHNNTDGKKHISEKIVIPSLNIESISIPNSKLQTTNKLNNNNANKKQANTKIKLQKIKYPTTKKKCNGWEFDGASFEERCASGKEVITRKYYQCVSRNNEVIRIHDAVILKSGFDTPDADFVARISSFWEDDVGQFAGEMMMSVQWYYKPEQTTSKGNDVIKGQPMEVFASRHKDDNSIACIIDRCYVVTFSQFCRFKAQRQLLLEKRKTKPAMVPEINKHRSRFIPSPDFEPSLVFFCRYGYDYRSGKLIKSQY